MDIVGRLDEYERRLEEVVNGFDLSVVWGFGSLKKSFNDGLAVNKRLVGGQFVWFLKVQKLFDVFRHVKGEQYVFKKR